MKYIFIIRIICTIRRLPLSSCSDDIRWAGSPLCWDTLSVLSAPQSRFGDKLLEIRVVCPENGAAVLKGLTLHLYNQRKGSLLAYWDITREGKLQPRYIAVTTRKKRKKRKCFLHQEKKQGGKYQERLLRRTMVNRTYGTHKKPYNFHFLPTIFSPIYHSPP